ncbi:hypothetical protein AB3S75_000146 [Citrus x aurantiifolia]
MSTLMTFVWKSAVWWSTGKQHLCDIVCQSISSAFEICQIKAEKLSFHIFGKKTIPGHSWQKLKTVSKKHCQRRRSISFAAAASPHSKALQLASVWNFNLELTLLWCWLASSFIFSMPFPLQIFGRAAGGRENGNWAWWTNSLGVLHKAVNLQRGLKCSFHIVGLSQNAAFKLFVFGYNAACKLKAKKWL